MCILIIVNSIFLENVLNKYYIGWRDNEYLTQLLHDEVNRL